MGGSMPWKLEPAGGTGGGPQLSCRPIMGGSAWKLTLAGSGGGKPPIDAALRGDGLICGGPSLSATLIRQRASIWLARGSAGGRRDGTRVHAT